MWIKQGRALFGSLPVYSHTTSGRIDGTLAHEHDFIEVVVISRGRGLHRSGAGEQQIGAGDAILLTPGQWHAYAQREDLRVHDCCFHGSLLDDELAWLRRDPAVGRLLWAQPGGLHHRGLVMLKLPVTATRRCVQIMQTIGKADQPAARIAHLVLLLGELARHQQAPDAQPPQRRTHDPQDCVVEGLRLMQSDLAHPWTLDELAQRCERERAYLVRLFRRHAGLPPMALLMKLRLERAASLLLWTDEPVGAIARQVGIDDANHFARRFKARFGTSATTYRAQQLPGSGAITRPKAV